MASDSCSAPAAYRPRYRIEACFVSSPRCTLHAASASAVSRSIAYVNRFIARCQVARLLAVSPAVSRSHAVGRPIARCLRQLHRLLRSFRCMLSRRTDTCFPRTLSFAMSLCRSIARRRSLSDCERRRQPGRSFRLACCLSLRCMVPWCHSPCPLAVSRPTCRCHALHRSLSIALLLAAIRRVCCSIRRYQWAHCSRPVIRPSVPAVSVARCQCGRGY